MIGPAAAMRTSRVDLMSTKNRAKSSWMAIQNDSTKPGEGERERKRGEEEEGRGGREREKKGGREKGQIFRGTNRVNYWEKVSTDGLSRQTTTDTYTESA